MAIPETPLSRVEQYAEAIYQKLNAGSGGSGVPIGGTKGQMLVKKSSAPGDTEWVDSVEFTYDADYQSLEINTRT